RLRSWPSSMVSVDLADEVALAERHALMAQDVVSGGDVEKEVRQRKAEQVALADELELHVADLQRNGPRLAAIHRCRRHAAEIVERAGDARLQLVDRLLLVGEARR